MTTPNATTGLQSNATTAAELMKRNLVSVREDALASEAIAALIRRGIGAAPVIDEAGRSVGVLSRTDILLHDRDRNSQETKGGDDVPVIVRDLMTPAVFTVPLDAEIAQIVDEMLRLRVHHLFVADQAGVLVGVISALDIVRQLHPRSSCR